MMRFTLPAFICFCLLFLSSCAQGPPQEVKEFSGQVCNCIQEKLKVNQQENRSMTVGFAFEQCAGQDTTQLNTLQKNHNYETRKDLMRGVQKGMQSNCSKMASRLKNSGLWKTSFQ
jgi:hypothetical protein